MEGDVIYVEAAQFALIVGLCAVVWQQAGLIETLYGRLHQLTDTVDRVMVVVRRGRKQ